MSERLKALMLYRIMMKALTTPGIQRLIVMLADDGELEVNVETKSPGKPGTIDAQNE